MSDEKDGIFDSLLSAVKSRVGNPLIGSFIISWGVLNWRFLGILFTGDEQMVHKIRMLEVEYMSPWRMLVAPLIVASVWALFFPYLDNIIENVRRKPLREAQNKRIAEEIEFIKLRQELSKETTALIVEEKQAANFGFSDYRENDLTNAQREIEYHEEKIKDLERMRAASSGETDRESISREIQRAIRGLATARDNQRNLRIHIEQERADKIREASSAPLESIGKNAWGALKDKLTPKQ